MKVKVFLYLAEIRRNPIGIENYWLKTIAAHLKGAVKKGVIDPEWTIDEAFRRLLELSPQEMFELGRWSQEKEQFFKEVISR